MNSTYSTIVNLTEGKNLGKVITDTEIAASLPSRCALDTALGDNNITIFEINAKFKKFCNVIANLLKVGVAI